MYSGHDETVEEKSHCDTALAIMYINYMQGTYIELPCDYYIHHAHLHGVLLWAHHAHLHGV